MNNEINFISVYLLKCTIRFFRRNCLILLFLLLLYLLIFNSAPNTPKRVTVGGDFGKETYDDAELTEWLPARKSISRPEEPGNLGRAVIVPDSLKENATRRFTENYFNVVANELMPLDRTLTDFREPECKEFEYPTKLPTVSVIIIYHNEAWSALARTVWSVINRTPKQLLAEIILVDDFSDKTDLRDFLDDHFETVPLRIVKIRTERRVGLVGARLMGAKKAMGQVLVFLDSHCEANDGWSEPLLHQISLNRKTFVEPSIDRILKDTMEVQPESRNYYGFFDMKLYYFGDEMNKFGDQSLATTPRRNVAMAGGLFAVDREYFHHLGAYDDQMAIWGGENIELSIRIWACGGQLIKAPCSRVSHIFRNNAPYTHPGGIYETIYGNMARVADVWLDDHKEIFYSMVPDARKMRTDVSERQKLRHRHKCKSFRWFLNNIFPQSSFNKPHVFIGQIRNAEHDVCLDIGSGNSTSLHAQRCHGLRGNQGFMFTDDHQIRSGRYCLAALSTGQPVRKVTCIDRNDGITEQYWVHDKDNGAINHATGENCLTSNGGGKLSIDICSGADNQKWFLE